MTDAFKEKTPHAWDPNLPARLLVFKAKPPPANDERGSVGGPQLDYIWSHTGASSCSKHEISALVKILQAHDHFHERLDREIVSSQPSKVFSRKCREAVRDCLLEWEEQRGESVYGQDIFEKDSESTNQNDENMELLKVMFGAMHLSDVIMPLLPTNAWTEDYRQDPFGLPGAATADFIRYLRYHHVTGAESIDPAVPEMLESSQPDEYGDGSLYWRYLESLVGRGCLKGAWNLLERHSLFQSSIKMASNQTAADRFPTSPGFVDAMKHVRDDFLIIKEVLCRAPIPGGRDDIYDDAIDLPKTEDDEMEYFDLPSLDVAPADYKIWEIDTYGDETGDFPLIYIPDKAIRRFKAWKDFVRQHVRYKLKILRSLPGLNRILAILCGDFTDVTFDGWSEKICADILYRKPDCKPRDLSEITRRAMIDFGADQEPLSGAIVDIMAGNAGTAIKTLYDMGGSSGAALPATLTSVFYNMFLESNVISPDFSLFKNEFLTEAALAIMSSLAPIDSDTGAEMATRLLLPYTLEEDASPEITACFANILEHYNPGSDANAESVLSRCEKLLKQNNLLVVEGCASIVLCRYRFHRDHSRPGTGLSWLFKGITLESMVHGNFDSGSCYRTLSQLCYSTATEILDAVSKGVELDGSIHVLAQELASAVKLDNTTLAGKVKARDLPPVAALMQAQTMFDAILLGDSTLVAKCVVACVEDSADKIVGTPMPLLSVSMQIPMLEIACKLIENEFDAAIESGGFPTTCCFDKEGLTALMESLLRVETFASGNDTVDVGGLKEIFAQALAQAFVSENAMKQVLGSAPWKSIDDVGSVRSGEISKHSPSIQEAVVRRMLDF